MRAGILYEIFTGPVRLYHRRMAFFLLLCLVPTGLFGQMTARGIGMGGAYTALARGYHAQAWNPANLGLPDNSKFSFTFISVGARVRNNSFTKGLWDKYVYGDGDGVHWTQQDIDDILSHIPDSGFDMDVGASVKTLSFSVGRFALSFGADVMSFIRLDKTLFELPLKGNELGKTYNLQNVEGIGVGIGTASLSWGQPIQVNFADVLALGATAHLLYAAGYSNVDRAVASFKTADYGFDVDWDYEVSYAYLGKIGLGLDAGLAAQFGEKWTVSLGLANVLGSLSWPDSVYKEIGYGIGDSLSVFSLSEDDDEDALEDTSWSVERAGLLSTRLPTILRFGIAYREGPILLTADYCQGFKDGAWACTKPQFAVGTEWSGLKWLPLRLGVVMGGRIGFGTSFGFGFRPGGFVLDVGMMNRGFISPSNSKGLILALEIGIDLRKKESEVVRVKDF